MKSRITIAIGLIIILNSCKKDFLEKNPETFVSSTTFYKSEADFEQANSGMYAALHDLYSDAYVMGEMRSDNAYLVYKSNDRGGQNVSKEQISHFLDDPQNQYSNNKYYSAYRIISRANAILGRIDAVEFDDAKKKNFKGQAEFLRAFCYFELVQYFGNVPLYLQEVKNQSETSLPQAKKEDVYKQIIADATDAASLLPATQENKGQVTTGTAKMLLGYVYMTLKQYPDAETVLKDITGLGYSLLPDYAQVFDPAN